MNNYNNLDTSKLNYVLYCRKSSESEDQQVQSLETQSRELSEYAKRNDLNIVKVITESKSAFKIGREGFAEMTDLIETGKANAILVIRANRISRNPIDAGYVISLMDEKKLLYIRTSNSTCYTSSSADKMMIGLELIISKKDSDDKGDSVKDGQRTKAIKGIPHGLAPIGFLNDKSEEKGNRKLKVDWDRFNTLKILFEMFLTGTYSAGKLHRYAVEVLKLTTVKHKRIGGSFITLSRIYEILKDPIYAGFFYYEGIKYELDSTLPRIITEDQHEKIKAILAKRNIPKSQQHATTYAGFIESEEGNFMGQDVKFQIICDCKKKISYLNKTHCPYCERKIDQLENPKYLSYVMYYDVKKKKSRQKYKSIEESKITEKLIDFIDSNLNFSSDLANWSKKYISELKDKEINENIYRKKKEESDKAEFDKKKSKLRRMLMDELISSDEYKKDLRRLNIEYSINENSSEQIDWYAKMNEIVDLTTSMKEVLEKGGIQAKRNILSKLGSNLIWNDKELSIINDISIEKLIQGIRCIKSKNPEFEPKNYVENKGEKEKTPLENEVFSTMLPR